MGWWREESPESTPIVFALWNSRLSNLCYLILRTPDSTFLNDFSLLQSLHSYLWTRKKNRWIICRKWGERHVVGTADGWACGHIAVSVVPSTTLWKCTFIQGRGRGRDSRFQVLTCNSTSARILLRHLNSRESGELSRLRSDYLSSPWSFDIKPPTTKVKNYFQFVATDFLMLSFFSCRIWSNYINDLSMPRWPHKGLANA